MTTTALTSEWPDLELALKSLWGASRWPGFADSTVVLSPPLWQEALRRLQQLIAVRASGLLHGPTGVGKSFLIQSLDRTTVSQAIPSSTPEPQHAHGQRPLAPVGQPD